MDKASLLKRAFPVEDFEIEGLGTIKIRGLARGEVNELVSKEPDQNEFDRFVLSRAVVEPKLTEDEVAEWQAVSPPNEIGSVVEAVMSLSGLQAGADKAAYKSAG